MEFRESQPIYLQIAETICEKIILKEWKVDDRIPSVRELGVSLAVNPNTVMRTYEFLQTKDIIYNQRGVGLFVSASGYKNSLAYRKEEFTQKEMPIFFRSMVMLEMEVEELEPLFKKFMKNAFSKTKI